MNKLRPIKLKSRDLQVPSPVPETCTSSTVPNPRPPTTMPSTAPPCNCTNATCPNIAPTMQTIGSQATIPPDTSFVGYWHNLGGRSSRYSSHNICRHGSFSYWACSQWGHTPQSRSLRGGSAEEDRQLHSNRRRTRGTGCCPGTNTGGCGPGVGVALLQEQRESKHSEVREVTLFQCL